MYRSPVAFVASSSATTIRSSIGVGGIDWPSRYSAVMPRAAAACSPTRMRSEAAYDVVVITTVIFRGRPPLRSGAASRP